MRCGREQPHELGVKQVTIDCGILLDESVCRCEIQQFCKRLFQIDIRKLGLRLDILVEMQSFQYAVGCPRAVNRVDQIVLERIGHELFDAVVNHGCLRAYASLKTVIW